MFRTSPPQVTSAERRSTCTASVEAEAHAYPPDLDQHLAGCDLAILQGASPRARTSPPTTCRSFQHVIDVLGIGGTTALCLGGPSTVGSATAGPGRPDLDLGDLLRGALDAVVGRVGAGVTHDDAGRA